MTFGLNYAV